MLRGSMRSSLLSELSDIETVPIAWYDGIVSGLVRSPASAEWHFASLLAWSHETHEKVYAIVPLNRKRADRLLSLAIDGRSGANEEHWQAVLSELSIFRSEVSGKAILVRCRDLGGFVTAIAGVDVDDFGLRSQLGQDVELAFSEERIEIWLGLPELQISP